MELTFGDRGLRIIAYLAVGIAVPALIASFVITLLGFLGWESTGPVASVVLFATFMINMFAMVIVVHSFEGFNQRQITKMVWDECPDRVRIAGKALAAIGMLLFFAQVVLVMTGKAPEYVDDGFPPLVLGGFGITVHASTIAMMIGAMKLKSQLDSSRCTSGHPVPLTAKFCPECGGRVGRGASAQTTKPA